MRILYSALTEYFWMHITEVVNNMVELGHEVHVLGFLRARPRRLHPSAVYHNITLRNRGLREFADPGFWGALFHYGRAKLMARYPYSFYHSCLEDIVDRAQPDLVYERENARSLAVRLAHVRGIPSILEINGIASLEMEWKGQSESKVRCRLEHALQSIRCATAVVCVASGARDYYVAHGVEAQTFHVVPNGANVELFQPMDQRACREQLGLPLDARIIGYAGSLQIFYEMDVLIRAMPIILRNFPDAYLVVVGRDYPPPFGPGRAGLLALAEQVKVTDRTSFLNAVPYEELPYYLNAFDVGLLPLTRRRNDVVGVSPLKLWDYLSCSLPVVSSSVRGDVERLPDIGAGLLYRPGDSQDLAEKVCTIFQDSALAQRMGDNGRRYVLEHSTWRHVTERIMTIAEEIVASPTM